MMQSQDFEAEYPQEYQEEEEGYDYDEGYDEYWGDQPLYRGPSKDKTYDVMELDQLLKKIYQDSSSKLMLTYLPEEWNLMLYYFCDFSEHGLFHVIDQEQTGRKMIRYQQNYKPTVVHGECIVCCSETQLVKNSCGHACCFECWKGHIEANHTDRTLYELFPLCIWEGCYHRTNKLLMDKIWEIFPLEKKHFETLLCMKYARMSDKIRVCSKKGCSKAIVINFGTERSLVCSCKNIICRICGENDHYPLDCGDLKTWNKIFNAKEKQWLNEIVTQPCPMCKTPIDKNGGCIHMTCRCGHSFCWICLKVWKGHNNYGACNSVSKEDHEKKLMAEQQKKKTDEGYYNIRFEETKSQLERVENIVRRLNEIDMAKVTQQLNECQILNKDVAWLEQIRLFLLSGLGLLQTANIYLFFQREGYEYLREQLSILWRVLSKLDDFLLNKTSVVEKTKKQIIDANGGGPVKNDDVLINKVKSIFFGDWQSSKDLMGNAKNISDVVREGKFMSIRID